MLAIVRTTALFTATVERVGAVIRNFRVPSVAVFSLSAINPVPSGYTLPDKRTFGNTAPDESRAVTVTVDCEVPSRGNTAGDATIVRCTPNPEGPLRGGASWSCSVHPARTSTAQLTPAARERI